MVTRKLRKAKSALAMAVAATLSISTSAVYAAAPGADTATNAPYAADGGYAWRGLSSSPDENPKGTDNGGTGFGVWNFGGAYHIPDASPYVNANHFIDGVDFPHSTFNDLGSTGFALTTANATYATTNAARPFISPMQTGDVFSVKFDTPATYDVNQGDPNVWYPFAIIEMRNAAGVNTWGMETGSNFVYGDFPWRYTDATHTNTSIGAGIAPTATSDGSAFTFELTGTTTGSLIFDAGGANQTTLPIALKAGAPASISFTLYSNGSGDGGGGTTGEREFFFNDLSITNPNPNNEWKKTGANNGNWGDTAHWTNGIVPDATDANANFFSHASVDGNVTVTLDANRTVGAVNFNNAARNFTIAGTNTLTLATSVGSPSANVGAGNHTISAPVILNSNTAINAGIVGGSLTMTNLQTAPTIILSKFGPGLLAVNNVRTKSLVVNNGTVRVLPSSLAAGVSTLNTLTLSAVGGAKLDLTNNKLILKPTAAQSLNTYGSFNGSVYTGTSGLIATGRGTANFWDGTTGIITSQAAAIGSNFHSIGIARGLEVRPSTATETALWAGQTITGTDVLVMYTYGGDANLDGKLNIDDYVAIDQGIAAGLTGWSNGDFNYDGKINIDDYTTVIDSNIGNQSGIFFTGSGVDGGGVAAVPEPASGAFLGLVAGFMLRGRRSRHPAARS